MSCVVCGSIGPLAGKLCYRCHNVYETARIREGLDGRMSIHKGLTVVFESDLRSEDAEAVVAAIRMIKGVLGVNLVEASSDDWINRVRIRREMEQKLWNALREEDAG